MTLHIELCTFLMHLQCISKAPLHTLMYCAPDSTCYATPHCPLHLCLHTCHLCLFVCLFIYLCHQHCRQDNNMYPKKLKFCEFIPHKYESNWDIRMDIRTKRILA